MHRLLLSICFIIAIIQRFPSRSFCSKLSSPDSEIEIKIGDIFDEKGHLVIGANDVFDTELGEVIKPGSVQGQFLARVYESNFTHWTLDKKDLFAYDTREHKMINLIYSFSPLLSNLLTLLDWSLD